MAENSDKRPEPGAISGGASCSQFQMFDRREFLHTAAAGAAALAMPRWMQAAQSGLDAIRAEIEKRHDESVQRLQQ
jgi:hypothetical protein